MRGKEGPMNQLHNLMDVISTKENLLLAYRSAVKGKRYRQEVLIFKQDLEINIDMLHDELTSDTYEVGPYRQFYVVIPKTRLVMALHFRDRVVQWALYRQLNPYLDKRFIYDTYGCREGKGTLAAAERLLHWIRVVSRKPDHENWFYLKLDIAKFFYRVDHEVMMDMMRDLTDDPRFLALMYRIINNPTVPFGLPEGIKAHDCPVEQRLFDVGMPIGNLSSQMLANLYLDPLDKFCKHTLGIHYYIRYMDDIVILSNNVEELLSIMNMIGEFLDKRLKLKLNSKTSIRPVKCGVEFVGYRINATGLRLRRSTAKRIKRVLKHLSAEYAAGNIEISDIKPTLASYFGIMKHCESYNLRRWITENISFCRGDRVGNDIPGIERLMEDDWYRHVDVMEEDISYEYTY